MNDLVISHIRTYVPLAVFAVVRFLARYGVEVDDMTTELLVTGIAGLAAAIYYAGVRYLEARRPGIGKLLGVASAPKYPDAIDTTAR